MKHELLAPAGNLNIFYAVIKAGADAVYIGGPKFGARAYAQNFTQEEILSAITYAHLHGVKVYMTVNTLVKNEELDECIQMMVPFYEAGLDGVILQDIGILRAFSHHFPGMELHASTQMSISDVEGARLLKKSGVTRVVTSRELSLREVKEIREKAGIEVECFIHGALCYSYSGQCLMSSMIGGRSGNRGRCAQPCRLPYEVLTKDGSVRKSSCTILSLKDLCTIQFLPDLLEAGVDSLKIEGRMKQASYAYTVVSIYRKYIDLYLKYGRDGYAVSDEDYQRLLDAGNREGFSEGYFYQHNGKDMVTLSDSAHNSSAGEQDEKELCQPIKLTVQAKGEFLKGQPARMTLSYNEQTIEVLGCVVEQARNSAMDEEKIRRQLLKTGNSYVCFEGLSLVADPDIFLPVSELNKLRRDAIDTLYEVLLSRRTYKGRVSEADQASGKQFSGLKRQIKVSVLIADYRDVTFLLEKEYIKRIYIELFFLKEEDLPKVTTLLKMAIERGKEVYGAFPFVLRKESEGLLEKRLQQLSGLLSGVLVRSYDGLMYAERFSLPIMADEPLYSFSDEAIRQLESWNVKEDTVPYELSEREILCRDNRFSEMVVYGRFPVMVSAGCVYKNTGSCDKTSGALFLKDRKNYRFPVLNVCQGCYNVIYNSLPTCLFQRSFEPDKYNLASVRLQFITESRNEMQQVFALFEQQVLGMRSLSEPLIEFTWGHFKKGVL